MSIGLSNALKMFMVLMNCIFNHYFYSFMIVFIGDILVYSRSREEHEQYLRTVLHILSDHRHFVKSCKCKFFLESVTFLGHVVIRMGFWRI